MNCPNCGAAMSPVPRRNYFSCRYCATFHFPDAAAAGQDRIVELSTRAAYACPVCRLPLANARADAFDAMSCTTCRGVLLRNDDFGMLVRLRRKLRTTPAHEPEPLNAAELSRRLSCVACNKPMDVHPYYGPGSVVIDTCFDCRLIWVDCGELFLIEHAPGGIKE